MEKILKSVDIINRQIIPLKTGTWWAIIPLDNMGCPTEVTAMFASEDEAIAWVSVNTPNNAKGRVAVFELAPGFSR